MSTCRLSTCRSLRACPALGRVRARFSYQYARAREAQADTLFDEILDIADDCRADHEEINRARLRIDSRKWMAGKLAPKKYSDKISHELGGVNGGPIVVRWKEPGEVL